MVKNLSFLLSVAFSVSFVLSLFVNRDIKTAFLTGLITLPATFSGVVAANRKQRIQHKPNLTALEIEIYQLERWETELHHSLAVLAAEKQRTEANINFLKLELSQLYTQTAEQRSYKQQLSQDLITLGEQRRKLEAQSHDLQTQIQDLEQRRGELYQSLRSIKAEKQNAEASFNSTPAEFKHLQVQISEWQNQKQELENKLTLLTRMQPQLEEKLHNLRYQIQVLEKSKDELNQSLLELTTTKQITENTVNSLQAELIQLQTQKKKTEPKLITFKEEKYSLEADKKLSDEWNEFMMRLPKYEFQVLKALVSQGNPNTTIKKIAEANITMPELLIDLINKRALNTINDLIIEPGLGSVPPIIIEEYLTNVKQVIKIKEMN